MIFNAIFNAACAVLMLWNAIFIFNHYRHVFAKKLFRLFRSKKERNLFEMTDEFADAVHGQAHAYRLDVVGVVRDQERGALSTYVFGPEACEADNLKRAELYEKAAMLLMNDALGIRESVGVVEAKK